MAVVRPKKVIGWLIGTAQYLQYLNASRIRPVKRQVTQKIRASLPWILAVVLGLILGWQITQIAMPKIIAIFVSIIACILIMWRLEIGIITVIALTATTVHPDVIPRPITIGGQGPRASELIILFMLVVVVFRSLRHKQFDFFKSPMTLPLILLSLSVVLSIFVSYEYHRQHFTGPWQFHNVYNSARPMFHYLIFFVVAFGIQTRRQLTIVLRAVVWMAVIVSLMMVVQHFLGSRVSLFVAGKYNEAAFSQSLAGDVEANVAGDIVRFFPPGVALITAFFLISVSRAAHKGRKGVIDIITSVILGIGLVFTWHRHFWISSVAALGIVWLLSSKAVRIRLAVIGTVVFATIVLGSVTLGQVAPGSAGGKFAIALNERFMTIFEPAKTLKSKSLQNRFIENRKAISQIRKHTWFGIGAGSPLQYRSRYNPLTNSQEIHQVSFMHNSYLELWLIYGLLGLVSFIWLSIAFLLRAYFLYKCEDDLLTKGFAAASIAAYIAFLERSITQMHIIHDIYHMLTVAVLWGVIEVFWRLYKEKLQSRIKEQDILLEPAVVH